MKAVGAVTVLCPLQAAGLWLAERSATSSSRTPQSSFIQAPVSPLLASGLHVSVMKDSEHQYVKEAFLHMLILQDLNGVVGGAEPLLAKARALVQAVKAKFPTQADPDELSQCDNDATQATQQSHGDLFTILSPSNDDNHVLKHAIHVGTGNIPCYVNYKKVADSIVGSSSGSPSIHAHVNKEEEAVSSVLTAMIDGALVGRLAAATKLAEKEDEFTAGTKEKLGAWAAALPKVTAEQDIKLAAASEKIKAAYTEAKAAADVGTDDEEKKAWSQAGEFTDFFNQLKIQVAPPQESAEPQQPQQPQQQQQHDDCVGDDGAITAKETLAQVEALPDCTATFLKRKNDFTLCRVGDGTGVEGGKTFVLKKANKDGQEGLSPSIDADSSLLTGPLKFCAGG